MQFDRAHFFAAVRAPLFPHGMTPAQIAGCEAILDALETEAITNIHWCAYVLATTYHETGQKMQPVREVGEGRGRPYGRPDPLTGKVYYGRGLVQLTWKTNYDKFGRLLGVDLVHDPDSALDPAISARILVKGMVGGLFTGKTLAEYFHGALADWIEARRIVNGLDRAVEIAGYAKHFATALAAAGPRPPIAKAA